MKGLKHVISFEYLNVVRRKAYLFSILFYLVLMVMLSFLPNIIDFFSRDDMQINHGVALLLDEAPFHNMDINLLAEYFPQFEWKTTTYREMEYAIKTGQAAFALHFTDVASYRVIITDTNLAPNFYLMDLFVREVNHRFLFDTLNAAYTPHMPVSMQWYIVDLAQEDGGVVGDYNWIGPAGAVIGNVALVLTLMAVLSSGGGIMASVMKEKTSKIVELLFTSAAPAAIMLGKVISAALVGLTTGTILAGSMFILTRFNNPLMNLLGDGGNLFYGYPMVTFVYLVVFFIIAFVCMSFIYAGMAATVGDSQESATLATLPMFVVIGAFYLGIMLLGNPAFISETFVAVISYVPFVSPFAMIARLNTVILPTWEVLLIIGLNIIYTIGAAFISSKIYQMCIMLFGHKITFRFLVKKLVKG